MADSGDWSGAEGKLFLKPPPLFSCARYLLAYLQMAYDFTGGAFEGPSDSPWDENTSDVRDAEWTRISSDFTNVRPTCVPYNFQRLICLCIGD